MIDLLESYISQYDNICFSGGALGADHFFGLWCEENDIPYIHFSFHKHRIYSTENVLEVPNDYLVSSDVQYALKLANSTLNRKIPKPPTYNLLARNYYQVLYTERVYAVSVLESPTRVKGGTAWAVQMYLDKCKAQGITPEVYVYDYLEDVVYSYIDGYFQEVHSIPTPHGKWTGIGSRDVPQNKFKIHEYYS